MPWSIGTLAAVLSSWHESYFVPGMRWCGRVRAGNSNAQAVRPEVWTWKKKKATHTLDANVMMSSTTSRHLLRLPCPTKFLIKFSIPWLIDSCSVLVLHRTPGLSRLSSSNFICAGRCLITRCLAPPFQESEIARLQTKISSLERASELRSSTLHHESSTLPPLSPPFKDTLPSFAPSLNDPLARSSISSASQKEASTDVSLELSESLKASVKAALEQPSSPRSGWQGLSHTELSSSSDMTFNPLTYMLDGEEPEEPDMDSLSGMLRFVNQTLALQEQHQASTRSTASQNSNGGISEWWLYNQTLRITQFLVVSVLLQGPPWRRLSRGRVMTGNADI